MRSILITMGLLAVLLVAPFTAQAQVPGEIPVQGYITDTEGTPYDYEMAMVFTLYDASVGGTTLFAERIMVPVDEGVFTAYLGRTAELDLDIFRNNTRVYLGVQPGSDPEASPRLLFGSVPYAVLASVAEAAESFGGVDEADFPSTVEDWSREVCLDTEEELTALLDDNYRPSGWVPDWDEITGIPDDIADGDDGFTSEGELTALLDDNYRPRSWVPNWSDITGIPAGFADGVDNGFTTEAELAALLDDNYRPRGWVPSWDDVTGIPAGFADGTDNDTLYSAGTGLSLDRTTFNVEFGDEGEEDVAARADAIGLLRDEVEDMVNERLGGYQPRVPPNTAVFRWNVFSTYANNIGGGWVMNNRPEMFGGVHPSNWTDGNQGAPHMSGDARVLRTLLHQRGTAYQNVMIWSESYWMYSSTNGRVVVALFRINNTTGGAITWHPYIYYTCFRGWGETARVAINGSQVWESGGEDCGTDNQTNFDISVPARRISTIIFTSPSSREWSNHADMHQRHVQLSFYNDSLRLPAGLVYVDDLDEQTGGLW